MKKSVIMIILLVYVASLCIVGFFGAKIIVYDKNVPVEDIVCKTDGVVFTKDVDNAVIRAKAEPSAEFANGVEYYYETNYSEGLRIAFTFETKPDNASTGGVDYALQASGRYSHEIIDDGKTCLITINKNGLTELYLTVISKDKKISKVVYVRVVPKK